MSHTQCDPIIRILRARSLARKVRRHSEATADEAARHMARVAAWHRVSIEQIMAPRGYQQKRARQAVARHLRFSLKWKFDAIGAFLNCHHTTVMGACRGTEAA